MIAYIITYVHLLITIKKFVAFFRKFSLIIFLPSENSNTTILYVPMSRFHVVHTRQSSV
jgi:hypothetical protein